MLTAAEEQELGSESPSLPLWMIRYYKLGDHSVFVVLVVLEGLQEVVVFGEGLLSPCLGHVERSVFHLLAPESDCLLPLVPHAGVDQLL